MERKWKFIVNPFLVVTENSYRAMQKIGDYTLNALRAVASDTPPSSPSIKALTTATDDTAYFTELKTRLEPFVLDFRAKYATFGNQQGVQKSQTSTLANTLAVLSSDKIMLWDLQVQSIYRIGSPDYERLLPNRRVPFQNGKQEDRIKAVRSFKIGVDADIAMPVALKNDVNDFLTQLESDFDKKDTQKTRTSDISMQVEKSREALCKCLYGILGNMMDHFQDDPNRITIFFDQESIRTHIQTTFRHKVKAGGTFDVLEHTFEATDKLKLTNDGETDLRFYLVAQKSDGLGSTMITVKAKKEEMVTPAMLGNPSSRFLKAENMSTNKEGHYVVSII